MSRLWTGPWVVGLLGEPGQPQHWEAPAGAIAALDTRTLDQCALTPGVDPAEGSGLFQTDDATDLGAGYIEVPPTIGRAARAQLEDVFGLTGLTATTPRDLVIDLLTMHADPLGVIFCPPLMPDHTGRLVLHFADIPFDVRVDPTSPYWGPIAAVLQAEYRQLRAECLAGTVLNRDPLFYRRRLSVWQDQFAWGDVRAFIPADLPLEEPLPHQTAIGDNFNGADNVSVLGIQLTWASTGSWWNASNEGRTSAVEASTRAESDLSSADQSVQVVRTNTTDTYLAPCARHSTSTFTLYGCHVGAGAFSGDIKIFKVIAGSRTSLTTSNATASALNDLLKFTANGSSLTGFLNGTIVQGPLTDTSITSGTRTGLWSYVGVTGNFDDFAASDLTVSAPPVVRRPVLVLQAVNRAATY